MKKSLLILLIAAFSASLFAQAPEFFNFQTVVRDESGQVVPLREISLKFVLHTDSPSGDIVYQEKHIVTTNPMGLVSLTIGSGEVLQGSFSQINWSQGEYFLEELVDLGNTGDFQVFGTVQLLSVPYAMHTNTASGIQSMTTEERDALENPAVGTQIYNTTTNCLNYWSGNNWFETCGGCTPMPSQANAGNDQYFSDETTATYLQGNLPESGAGAWSVVSGSGGSFVDPANHEALFNGLPCESYVLMWEISTSCGSTSDMVSIQFDAIPTTAMAGNDIEVYTEELTVQLSGNTPQTGSGLWTVISGDGGVFSDATNPQTEFTGSPCESYALGWTISTACYENTDEINVIFDAVPSLANAGGDIVIFDENNVLTLNAQSPEVGSGLWSIVSGAGGIFADPYNPATTFTAAPCETYNLRWTVATECDENFDEISVSFDNSPAIVNAGADITICENNAPVLQGTAQNYQALLWETSGTGAFSNPEILNPAYIPGDEDKENGEVSLTLTAWPPSPCADPVFDQLTLSIQLFAFANAGDDDIICETDTYTLQGFAENYTSVLWASFGDGTFSVNNTINPEYFPGQQDIAYGVVTLLLTVQPLSPCNVMANDQISLDIVAAPDAYAGDDATICADQYIDLSGSFDNSNSVYWETDGDGVFDNPTSLVTKYTPGDNDKQVGQVFLSLIAIPWEPCVNHAEDMLTLTIEPSPLADAGDDAEVCANELYTLNGQAQYFSSVIWSSSGTGNFDNAFILNPEYTPSGSDIGNGSVILTLTAEPLTPCATATSDEMTLVFLEVPFVNAGPDQEDLEVYSTTLQGNNPSGGATGEWTIASGQGGNVVEPVNPHSVFTGLPNETYLLQWSITGQNGCMNSDYVIIGFSAEQLFVWAGTDIVICEGESVNLIGSGSNFETLNWSTNGDGTFTEQNSLETEYIPGINDIQSGQVELCIEATTLGGNISLTDCMNLTIIPLATVNAGDDNVICDVENHPLSSSSATNYEILDWTTSGDGTFSNPSAVNPVYYPGTADINTGNVELTISATAVSPCAQDIVDTKTLSIVKSVVVNAGSDFEICETATHQLNGSVDNESSFLWFTSGDGQFSNANIENPVYTPGSIDKVAGTVTLTLTAQPNSPCQASDSDFIDLAIQLAVTAAAGLDGQVCANSVFQLNGSAQNFTSVFWTTDGDGDFDNPELLYAVYTPGETDISNGEATLTLTAQPLSPCDATYTDEVLVSVLPIPDISAGDDFIACTTQDVELFASANNISTVQWTTSGSGTFTEPNSLNTVYVAQGNDFAYGVNLTACAQAIDPCEATVCDVVNVSFVPGPTVFGMTSTAACENNFMVVSGVAYNYSTTEWTTAGDGTFENPGAFSTKYYPGPMDISNEGVLVTLNAYPIGDCDAAVKDVILNIVNLPNIFFGPNSGNICFGDDFLQLDATVVFSNSIVWSTNGDGTFSNTHIANPKYFPGTQDEQNGQFELELLAYPLPYCSVSTIEPLLVTYQENPVSDAGSNAQICENETYTLSEASASSYSQIMWSGGNGTFSSTSALKPTYTPSPQDYGTTVTLCLEAAPISPCDVASSDSLKLTINNAPFIFINPGATICGNEQFVTEGFATNYSALNWSSQGDGTFVNSDQIVATYFPGSQDIQNGSVQICLTAVAFDGCEDVSECLTLTLNPSAFANAGSYQPICEDGSLQLSGLAEDFETVLWESLGDGTFDNQNALNATYSPGSNDIANKQFSLQLTAYSSTSCGDAISQTTVSILDNPMVNAGEDQENLTGTTILNGNNPPTGGSGQWAIASGEGGNIIEPANPQSVFTGLPNETYLLQWSITGQNGCVNSDYVIIGFADFWQCGQQLLDERDGQEYSTVQIGEQCWMAENLAFLPAVSPSNEVSYTEPYYYVYDYSGSNLTEAKGTDNYQNYGVLYNWPAAMITCPEGWSLPTNDEWVTMSNYLGGSNIAGGKLKSTRTDPELHPRWNQPNTGASNVSGFTAFPGGHNWGSFEQIGEHGFWWTSTIDEISNAYLTVLWKNGSDLNVNYYDYKSWGLSVRCILNDSALHNFPPGQPHSQVPENGSTNISSDADLSWSCSDPENDTLTYDVYFGTEPTPPQVATAIADTFYIPGTLEYATTYYWKIVAHDDRGNSTEGEVWSFTTEISSPIEVTFLVDMSEQSISPNGVHIAGNFQDWNPATTEMTFYQDNIYVYTSEFYEGEVLEYIFLNGNVWGMNENVPAGCTLNGNRFLTVPGSYLTLDTVCFGNCNVCNPPLVDITFQVDMSNESVSANGVHITGSFQDSPWNTGTTELLPVGNGVYAVTIPIGAGDYHEYKFVNGNTWGDDETVPPACTVGSNRFITIPDVSTTLEAVCFGSCYPCGSTPIDINVTFQVDMSEELVSPDGVHIGGTFQGWNPSTLEMTDAGDNIFTYTTVLSSGSYQEYRFINGTTWEESESISTDCGNNSNRFLTIPNNDTILTPLCYNSCTQCLPIPWECGDSLLDDRDGQKYATVQIGEQCWMAENLNYGIATEAQGNNGIVEKFCYNNEDSLCEKYGGLYNWYEIVQYDLNSQGLVQGICPDGWHIPDYDEYSVLIDSFGGADIAGYKLKSSSGWSNYNGNNESGFNAIPTGSRYLDPYTGYHYDNLYNSTNIWSSTYQYDDNSWLEARSIGLTANNYYNVSTGFNRVDLKFNPLRCLKYPNNLPPNNLLNISPFDGAVNQGLENELQWSCTDPENDPLNYDIYFGTESAPPQVATAITDTFYIPGTLDFATTYYWKIIAHDDHGNTTEGVVWSFSTMDEPWQCGDLLVDERDGQSYETVQIGEQCWMAENLNVGIDVGVPMLPLQSDNGIIEKSCFGSATENCENYGGIYNWNEAMQYSEDEASQGICPMGWYIPSLDDFLTLKNQFGGGGLKSTRTYPADHPRWWTENVGATNESGFSGLPGGAFWLESATKSIWVDLGYIGYWWSSTQGQSSKAIELDLYYGHSNAQCQEMPLTSGISVRCIKR